jgi:WD40 repeat protein
MKLFATVLGIGAALGMILPTLSAPRELIIKGAYGVSGFSSDGKNVYTYIMENGIRSYNTLTGSLTKTLKLPQELKGKAMGSIRFLENQDYYLNNPQDGHSTSLYLIESKTGKIIWTYTPVWKANSDNNGVFFSISEISDVIAITPRTPGYFGIDTITESGELDLISLKTGKLIIKTILKEDYKNTLQGYPAEKLREMICHGVSITSDGKIIIYTYLNYINQIDVKTLKVIKTSVLEKGTTKNGVNSNFFLNTKSEIMLAGFLSNETDDVTHEFIQYPAIYNWSNGKLIQVFKTHKNWVSIQRFSPDGKMVLVASQNENSTTKGSLWLWDVQMGKKIREFPNFELSSGVAFSPDSSRIAYGGSDNTIRVWQVR